MHRQYSGRGASSWFGYESRNRLNRSAAAANAVSLRTKDRRRPRLDGVDGMDALLRCGCSLVWRRSMSRRPLSSEVRSRRCTGKEQSTEPARVVDVKHGGLQGVDERLEGTPLPNADR